MNRRLPQEIVDKIEVIRIQSDNGIERIAEELHNEFKVSKFTSKKIIQQFTTGSIYGDNFNSKKQVPKGLEWLKRFAIYLDYIGIGHFDPIIDYMRRFDSRFNYPPKSSSKKPKKQYGLK